MLRLWIILSLLPALTTLFQPPSEAPPSPLDIAVPVEVALGPEDRFVLTVNGEEVALPVEPFEAEGQLYVPLYPVCAALGGLAREDGSGRILVTAPGLVLEIPLEGRWMEANGRCLYLPAGVLAPGGVPAVPLEALAAAFGAEALLDPSGRGAELSVPGGPIQSGEDFYDQEDLYWLSRLIDAEARGEPFEGKIAVGNVVMNRVRDESFPDTVKGVIFDRRCGIQFSPAYSGSIYREPAEDSLRAAKIALEGRSVVPAALYFSPAYRADRSWAGKNRPYLTQIGNHVFFT